MKHHRYNPSFKFIKYPIEFNLLTNRDLLQYCLGATLYMPGTKTISDKILTKNLPEVTSMVMCFEDAIKESDLLNAEENVLQHLETLNNAIHKGELTENDIPLTFVRVRNPEQFVSFAKKLHHDNSRLLSGFVFPKFSSSNGSQYLSCLYSLNDRLNATLYCMPLLEGKSIGYKETREKELCTIRDLLFPFKNSVINIRVGGTDLSSLFGVRRGINYSIYDILTVRDCLSDILNFFSRVEDEYVISGPVWEYFLAHSTDNIDNLLENNIHTSLLNRNPILNEALDGLLREVILDKANGFVGKTIIHPSHARFVNAMQAVTKEEYDDAMQILATKDGVIKSVKSNKMNEINPHRSWAKKIALRANAYGVVENEASYLKLLTGK
jgi:citrate lyase beta subunit